MVKRQSECRKALENLLGIVPVGVRVPFSLLLALWCNWQHDGSVIGESYSSRATLYIMYARTLLYIYLQFIKKNSIIARTCGESLHPPLFTSFRCTTSLLHPPRPSKIRGKNSATFFVSKNASSPCVLCQIFFCHTLYDKNI